MLRELLLGFARVHVLHHAAEAPLYGAWMMEELGRHGYEMGPGTLYPLLHRMEADGYLTSEERVVEGHVRKYYTATAAGREALAEARAKIVELAGEILGGEGPDSLPDPTNQPEHPS